MTSLVTGATGFIGSYLVESLCARGESVVALRRAGDSQATSNLRWVLGDLLDDTRMVQLMVDVRPDVIYHLAAQSYPGESWKDPQQTFHVNVTGTLNLLNAVRAAQIRPRIVITGSSAEYRATDDETPINEDHHLEPSSPYGVSKLAVTHLGRLFAKHYGMQILRARPFFLIGPRKTGDVCSDFARRIVTAEHAGVRVLRVGNLEVVRDLLDVRDGVRGFMQIADHGHAGEIYNICSSQGYRLRDILDEFKAMARVPLTEVFDSSLLRPINEKTLIGDSKKLCSLGWHPERNIHNALQDILEFWRGAGQSK